MAKITQQITKRRSDKQFYVWMHKYLEQESGGVSFRIFKDADKFK